MTKAALNLVLAAIALALPVVSAQAHDDRASSPGCATPLQLRQEAGFVDPRRQFAPDSAAFRATNANFQSAFQRACREGIAGRLTVSLQVDYIFLRNSPDANVASIFPVSINRRRGTEGMVLEYPFVTADGAVNVPTADDIHEAIYCRAVGATQREQEEDGRCLPD